MDNKEQFKKEYLCEWITPSEGYQRVYELWIDYEYNCEKLDRVICSGGFDKEGFVRPANTYELRLVNKNANYLIKKVYIKVRELEINNKNLENARRDVNRLTWKGIQEEYQRLYAYKK